MKRQDRPFVKSLGLALFLLFASPACTSGDKDSAAEITPPKDGSKGQAASADNPETPPLAVATVASLISVSDVMVREPERFKKALCSDGNIYDLDFDGSRFGLRAEPLSVCVLLADTKGLKPSGFCSDSSCESNPVNVCSEAEKNELGKNFAKDQEVQHCWNIGNYPPLSFQVLVSRVGQSCQAQSFVKDAKGFRILNSIDGTFEIRKGEGADGQGCFFESGAQNVADSDWFTRGKRVVPVMAFTKEDGTYTLLRTSWSGSENYQLFRLDGDKPIEIESFAEAFKDPSPEPVAAPPAEPKKADTKTKAKKGKKGAKPPKSAPVPAEEATPPGAEQPEVPKEDESVKETPVPEQGVNPLEGEQ